MPSVKGPCLNCKDRDIHCHSTCEKFKAYEDEYKEYKEKLDKYKREKFVNCAYISESIRRMSKKKKKK